MISPDAWPFSVGIPAYLSVASIKYCLKLDISLNNYPGILKFIQGKITGISGNFVFLKCW